MKPTLLLSLLFLAGCATSSGPTSYRQAAMAPMRPPAVRPVVNEPYFPTPGATPAGAGIEVPGPAGDVQVVPRSPNKRVLPASAELGVWAADGDPALKASASTARAPRILDVELPYPLAPGNPREGYMAKMCASQINDGLTKLGELPKAAALTPAERRCLAASMYALCAQMTQRKLTEAQGQPPPQELLNHVKQSLRLAAAFEEKNCPDDVLSSEGARIQRALAVYWSRVHGGLR